VLQNKKIGSLPQTQCQTMERSLYWLRCLTWVYGRTSRKYTAM